MLLLLIKHPVSSRFVCFAFVLKLLCGSEVVFPQNTHRHRWIKLLTLVVVADLNTSDWPMHSHAQYKTSAKKNILQIKHVDAMGVTLWWLVWKSWQLVEFYLQLWFLQRIIKINWDIMTYLNQCMLYIYWIVFQGNMTLNLKSSINAWCLLSQRIIVYVNINNCVIPILTKIIVIVFCHNRAALIFYSSIL